MGRDETVRTSDLTEWMFAQCNLRPCARAYLLGAGKLHNYGQITAGVPLHILLFRRDLIARLRTHLCLSSDYLRSLYEYYLIHLLRQFREFPCVMGQKPTAPHLAAGARAGYTCPLCPQGVSSNYGET